MSQKYLFPRSKNLDVRLSAREIFGAAPSRFRDRAAKSGRWNAPRLWGEAMEQVEEGWLPPLYLYQTMEIRRNGAPGGITFLSDSVFFNRASFAMGEI